MQRVEVFADQQHPAACHARIRRTVTTVSNSESARSSPGSALSTSLRHISSGSHQQADAGQCSCGEEAAYVQRDAGRTGERRVPRGWERSAKLVACTSPFVIFRFYYYPGMLGVFAYRG
eukprot:5088599-Prymnesium_polylepis.1